MHRIPGIPLPFTLCETYSHTREDNDLAWKFHQETYDIRYTLGDQWGLAGTRCCLAMICRRRRQFQEARRLHIESLKGYITVGDKLGICETLEGVAALEIDEQR